MGVMDARQAVLGPVLGAALGLASIIELAFRLIGTSTVRAGLAAGPAVHSGVSMPTTLVMCGFCLLATVPAGLLRPVPAAVIVLVASVLSLVLFELVTGGGAAALLVVAYRLSRGAPGGASSWAPGVAARVVAVGLAVPFLVLAVALAADPRSAPVVGTVSGLAGAGLETRVLAVLLASAIPVVALAGMARRAGEDSQVHSAVRQLTEGVLAEHLARGERARIARELHDVVAHHISMIAVQAETARLTTPGLTELGAQRLVAIGDTARAGLTEMRRLLGVLREDAATGEPDGAEAGAAGAVAAGAGAAGTMAVGAAAAGAAAAGAGAAGARRVADRHPQPGLSQLGALVDEARVASASAARLIVSGRVTRLDPGVELAAYRIVQEALTNARRHAPGAAVDVELRYADDVLRLRIRDNGPGTTDTTDTTGPTGPADPATAGGLAGRPAGGFAARPGGRPAGHGLLGMRERAAAAGGSLRTGEASGGGFCVEAELPAKAPDVTADPA
jgi:signal transduction histidine kinase